jgi:esterase/lipase superfamily enzyme
MELLSSCSGVRKSQAPQTQSIDHTRLKKEKATTVTVLYGTDRKITNSIQNHIEYGNQPSNPGSIKYNVGITTVSIPSNHKAGKIETPSIWRLEFMKDSLIHMVQKKTIILKDSDFNMMLKRAANGEDAFIFVHGYNNSFTEAALRTAQLAIDIRLSATPIMFSWSSNGRKANYMHDEDKVLLAVPAFKDFLKRIAKEGKFRKIHLIAHSMGNRLISNALLQLENDTTNLKIDQIIMAAPDVYADLFKINYADAIVKKAKHVTIYTAKNDWALLASKKIHGNLRLGEVGMPPPAFTFRNIDIIDAVAEKTDFLGHDRFATSKVILADIDSILRSGRNAADRKIPFKKIGDYLYYHF